MGFVCDSSGSSRFGAASAALLSAYGFTHEWRTDLAAKRVVVGGKYSQLTDTVGSWNITQGTPALRPTLVSVPPDEALFSSLNLTYLSSPNGIDPAANLTMVVAIDTTGSSGALRTALCIGSGSTSASWRLGFSASFGIAIFRRCDDTGAITAQVIPAVATGPLVLIAKLDAGSMKVSVNGAAFGTGVANAGSFTHTSMLTTMGATNTFSGPQEYADYLIGFGACKSGVVSDADAAGINAILAPLF